MKEERVDTIDLNIEDETFLLKQVGLTVWKRYGKFGFVLVNGDN